MSRELSDVLDHIEKISELELEGVPPTSHVIDVVNALRPDEPCPSLPRTSRSRPRPRSLEQRLRCPEPEPHERSGRADGARRRRAACARASSSAAELFEAYRDARCGRRRRPQRLHVGRRRRAVGSGGRRAARRRPARRQGPLLHRGRAEPAGSKILEGYRPPYTATVVARLRAGRRGAARQDQPGRVRDGLVERELGVRPGRATRGTATRVPGGSSGGSAAAVAAGLAPWALGHRHRRLDPPARRALRHRRPQADLRRASRATA